MRLLVLIAGLSMSAASCSGTAETVANPPATLRLSRTNATELQSAFARAPVSFVERHWIPAFAGMTVVLQASSRM